MRGTTLTEDEKKLAVVIAALISIIKLGTHTFIGNDHTNSLLAAEGFLTAVKKRYGDDFFTKDDGFKADLP